VLGSGSRQAAPGSQDTLGEMGGEAPLGWAVPGVALFCTWQNARGALEQVQTSLPSCSSTS